MKGCSKLQLWVTEPALMDVTRWIPADEVVPTQSSDRK